MHTLQSDGSGAGSIWSADGTSVTQSSCNEKATATRLPTGPQQLPASGQKHQLPASGQRRPTVVDMKANKTTSLLLVGDSNACGYCETQPYAKSLRCHLSDRFAVVTAAKAGAPWRQIASNIDGHIHQCSSGVAARRSFDLVFVVLGTNDIPLEKHWAKQQDLLKQSMQSVMCGLQGYLKENIPFAHIVISQAFNCEPDRAATQFTHLLQEVAEQTGACFLKVPWSEAEHSQTKTKTPLKHFNAVGVHLLGDLFFSVVESHLPVSGGVEVAKGSQAASSASALVQPPTSSSQEAISSRRLPTLRQNSQPRSVSSSSSSSHSSTISCASARLESTGHSNGNAPDKLHMVCEVCQTINHHTIDTLSLIHI